MSYNPIHSRSGPSLQGKGHESLQSASSSAPKKTWKPHPLQIILTLRLLYGFAYLHILSIYIYNASQGTPPNFADKKHMLQIYWKNLLFWCINPRKIP